MKDLWQVLARNSHLISKIVVPSRNDQFARAVIVDAAQTICGGDVEIALPPHHPLHPLILPDIEALLPSNFAVILQRLFPSRLLAGSAEWNIPSLPHLRPSKKGH